MRKLLIFSLVALFSSCSLLQKTRKNTDVSVTENTSGSEVKSLQVDSSKRKTTDWLRITIPGVGSPALPGFSASALPDLTGVSESQRKAFLDLKSKYDAVISANRAGSGMILEYQHSLEEALNKVKSESQKDTTSNKSNIDKSKEVKSPEALSWIGMGVIILTIIQVGKWGWAIYKRFTLKS